MDSEQPFRREFTLNGKVTAWITESAQWIDPNLTPDELRQTLNLSLGVVRDFVASRLLPTSDQLRNEDDDEPRQPWQTAQWRPE